MIGIQLKGRLGNQMFQYATARTLAEQLGTPLIISGHTITRRSGIVGHLLWLDKQRVNNEMLQLSMQQNGLLQSAFGCGPTVLQGRIIELAMALVRKVLLRRSFSPRKLLVGDGVSFEDFDETLFKQQSGTWLEGWFQSE